jgi:glycogen debranching enzyme
MQKFVILLIFAFTMTGFSQNNGGIIKDIGIAVKDTSRAFSFTNKKFGQYYGENNSGFTDGWMGWTLKENRIFNDYKLVINGAAADRKKAEAVVFPCALKRNYRDGMKEKFFFADSLDLVYISFEDIKGGSLKFIIEGISSGETPSLENNIVSLKIDKQIKGESLFVTCSSVIESVIKKENQLIISLKDTSKAGVLICVDKNPNEITNRLVKIQSLISQKENRIRKLLTDNFVKTSDEEFDKAFLWASASIDALITEQNAKGIFAGLPWFNNNWGRDTFISLPGATFVTGNYNDAKEILLAFAKYQEKDTASPYYGRIPNRVTLTESIYNTTDGTPWFVIQAYNYYKYSNDIDFLKEIYPAVKLAFEGAVKNYIDSSGFLTHKDAETWMDAVGPNGPWSPRGNRANDIQALWFKQLEYSCKMAELFNDKPFEEKCCAIAKKLKDNFEKYFVDKENFTIYDRIQKDGLPDKTIRPNLFFALNSKELIPSSLERLKILSNAMKELVFPYGVLSLSQNDDNFHPYHHYSPFYVQDAAYHNGIIWQWNTGPVVQALCGFGLQDKAWSLTSELTKQILHGGAAGTLSELSDAFPRPEEKECRLSGAFSQAWSLAEYIRNFYQDYLGVKPDAPNKTLYLIPSLPAALKDVEFFQKVGSDKLKITYDFNKEMCKITVKAIYVRDSLDLSIGLLNKANSNYQFKTTIKDTEEIEIQTSAYSTSLKDLTVKKSGAVIKVKAQICIEPKENQDICEKVQFAEPKLRGDLKTLRGPDYPLLSNYEVKKTNDKAKTIFNVDDLAYDELYQYPLNNNFTNGISDITNFTLREDSDYYYFSLKFRELVNPGWHNEYGFQLTYASICIANEAGKKGGDVGVNSNYTLPEARYYSRIINVGGGFEIKDSNGKILAAYLPQSEDVKNPLGNVASKEISFTVPKKYIGNIDSKTVISILSGTQDDAGGAGIGVFRDVDNAPSEWKGGANGKKPGSNIFDFLLIN